MVRVSETGLRGFNIGPNCSDRHPYSVELLENDLKTPESGGKQVAGPTQSTAMGRGRQQLRL
jgi:hypothetical protein